MNTRKYYDYESNVDIEVSINPDYPERVYLEISDPEGDCCSMTFDNEDLMNFISYLTELSQNI